MFLVDITIDRVNSFLESFLKEEEVDSSLFSPSGDNSLGVLILNIVRYEGFSPGEYWTFEESDGPEDLFCFQIELNRIEA